MKTNIPRIRVMLAVLASVAMLVNAMGQEGLVTIQGRKASAAGLLVKVKEGTSLAKVQAAKGRLGQLAMKTKAEFRSKGLMLVGKDVKGRVNAAMTNEELEQKAKELMATGLYDYVEPDWIVTVNQVPTDAAFTNGSLWGLKNTGQSGGTAGVDVNAQPAWAVTTGSPTVIVGVVDTGIRYTHQDLAANMWVNTGEIAGNGIDDDANGYIDDVHGINGITNTGDPMDDNDHGTHCAGTIGATANDAGQIVGVAWNVKLMGLKFLSASGSGSTSDAIKCIDYGVAKGAHILSNSWGGGGYSQALRDSIASASAAGVLFVAAAGNSSSNNDLTDNYPSNYDPANVVAVAAVDRTGALASFSSYGATTVDVGAPGVDVLSSTATSDSSYSSFSGTSMATPHVAGVAALIKSHFPSATMLEIKNRLMATTRPLASLAGRTVSGGIVDAHAALTVAADGVLELRAAAASSPLSSGALTAFYVTVTDLTPVTGATVTAALDSGTPVAFLDNGAAPDVTANDGIYSASLTVPATGSSTTLNVTASNGGPAATGAFAFPIVARPANDDFANRVLLAAGTTQTTGSNVLSSFETGEPLNPSVAGSKSVWWEWAAGTSGSITVTTSGSSYDTTLAVYSGSGTLASLVHLGSNDDYIGLASSVTFSATSGQLYYFQVNGFGSSTGSITLNYPAPANVNSPPAIVTQPAGVILVAGDPLALSVTASGTAPLSYQWALGGTNIPTATSSTYSVSSVTSADQGNYTVTITNAFGSITSATAFVGVDPISVRPPNDLFVNADVLAGATGRVSGTNLRASGESGEPNHAGASTPVESVWYRWTAPADGTLSLDTYGSSLDTTLAVYTGAAVNALTQRAANNDSGGVQSFVSVAVTAGEVLSIAVDGAGTAESLFSLNYLFQPTVAGLANDAFASRTVVSGAGGAFTGSNISATGEAGEPVHEASAPPTASVWWSWTAPAGGVAVIDTLGSDFDTALAVYTGSDVAALTLLTSNDDAGGPQSRVSFPCSAGTAYAIAVDGQGAAQGLITLNITSGATEPEIAVEQPAGTGLVDGGAGISWGNVATGENATRTFTVRNTGAARLTGLSVRIEGANAADFTLTTPPAASVNGGASTTFSVRFTPAGLGAHSAVLRVTSNDADEHPFDISLSGSGVPPAPEIVVEEPVGTGLVDGSATTAFGSVVVGSSASRTYTVRNTGNATLSGLAVTFSGANAADYSVTTPPAATVAPETSTSFTVSFAPGALGARSAALALANNDADENPFDVALNGTGITSPPVTRTINATDRGWYSSTGYHDTTNQNYFTGYSTNNTYPHLRSFFIFAIPALAPQEVVTSAELRLSAGTVITGDASETLEIREVTTPAGTLIAGLGGVAAFADFADGPIYAGPQSITPAQSNTNLSLPLNETAQTSVKAANGGDWVLGGDLTSITQIGNEYVFGATGLGGDVVQLVITTQIVTDAEIVVEQPAGTGLTDGVSSVSFGGIAPGTTADRVFTIRNLGINPLTGLGITIMGSNAADFSVTASPTAPLAPAGSTTFTVHFAPTAGGLKNAVLSIANNDPDENPFEIALTGTAVVPAPEIVVEQPVGTNLVDGTAAADFGYRGVGTNGSLVFTVRNTGTADLTGLGISIDGANAADFAVTASPTAPVAPAGSTTFTVQFAPSATGLRTAALHLASDDWDENPFDITLSGRGYTTPAGLEFKITSLGTTGAAVVDHDAITSDDRGGIALTTERVFVTGDSATSRHALTDLSGGASIGRVSNGICSDIGTGMAYVLAHNGVEIIGGSSTVSQLIELNPQTGALTGTIIPLSTSFVTGGPNGVFSGNGRIVIHNGTRVYDILVPSGVVNDLGPMSAPSWYGSESWASWGVAEYFDGSVHLAYRQNGTASIVRSRVPDGQVTTIGTFSNLGDMASWTVSPITNRWYFHYEGSAQFGGSSETLGYADATFEMGPPTQPPAIISPLTAAAYVGNPFSYQIRATRSPTSYNATGLPAGLSVNTTTGLLSGTPTATGTHTVSISATNVVGTTTETLTITVSTAFATVSLFVDPSYVYVPYVQQIRTALESLGCLVTTFTGTSTAEWDAAFASSQMVVMPTMTYSVNPSAATITAINTHLAAGKGLLIVGNSYSGYSFINTLRQWGVTDYGYVGSGNTLSKTAGVPDFVNSPVSLVTRNYVMLTSLSSLPEIARSIYIYATYGSAVFVAGRIGHVGYDWSSGPDVPWENVLKDSITAVQNYVNEPEMRVVNNSSALTDGHATPVNFGSAAIGATPANQIFAISNQGFASLTGLTITLDGANASDFSVTAAPTAPLAPTGSTSFTVRFAPTGEGTRTAALHIASNDADESSFDIQLSGTGFIPAPEIAVEQPAGTGLTDGVSSVAFGTAPLTASLSRTFTLRNTGTATLSGIALSFIGTHAGDFAVTTAPSATVSAGSSTTFTVRFIPGSAGARTATLQIASNDADENPFDVNLTGAGVLLRGTASLFANSSYVDTAISGEMENTRRALMNAGYAVTTFTGFAAADWNAAFAANVVVVPELEMSALVLAADALLAINTQLDAGKGFIVMGDVSTRETALLNSLRGWALASGSTLDSLTLTKVIGVPGFGNSPASLTALVSSYSITTASLPAGAQPVYQNGLNTAVFLHGRVGFMAYDWNAGPDSTWSTVLGDLITELTQVIDGPEIVVERPAGIGLTDGTSTAALGYAPVGGEVSSSFTLRNIGTQPLTGILASVDGIHAADFSVTTPPAETVAPGVSTTFIVRFAPSVAGNRSATLRIASNDANENPFDIALTGTTSQILFEDEFDPGIDTPLWSAFGGTVTANTAGQAAGSGSTGNSLHFNGSGSRFATTIPLNTTLGGGIGFKIALASGSSSLWETADSGEDAVIEYSNDGTTFTQIGGPYTNRTWQSVVVGIPVAAQTVSTRFRWRQLSNSGSGFDHWAIEDVQIGPAITTTPEIAVEQPVGTGLTDGVSTVTFGSVATGANASLTFTIRNSGSANLTSLAATIDGANAADFTVTTAPATSVVPAGTTTFVVRFAPGAAGSRSATLRLASNDVDENPFDINLSGTGFVPVPEIAVEQPVGTGLTDGVSTVTFGSVATGANASLTFTIRNSGSGNLTSLAATIDGANAADFTVTTAPATSVAPAGTTTFVVRFAPGAAGSRSATLRLASNDLDENPFDIILSGTGAIPVPEIAVEQPVGTGLTDGVSTVNFGPVATGANTTLTFTIRNSGSGNLTGLAATIDGPNAADFTVTTAPASTVAPAGTTTFVVRFAPGASGIRSAMLRLVSNDADENPFDINLSGTSLPPGTVTVVIPNAQTTLEGNSNNGFPFNLSSHGHTGMHYQQVYAASELGATGLVTITHLAFRKDVSNSAFASTLPDIQIELMTTAATPATLSTTYASNRGADAVMVHPRGSLSLSSSGTGTPPPFDIVIPLTTPFVYNPALGNLLMEVRNFGGGSTTQFDSQSSSASVGRVFNPTGNSDPNLAVGTHESSGLVTRFTFVNGDLTSAPEIAVEHPVGSNLTDGAASISFGSAAVPVSRVFTLRNTGSTALTGIAPTIDGANAADFSITTLPPASVAPGASATFTISFTPSTPGARAATLRIASNDADENPFDIALAATAVTPAGGLDNWLPPALPDRTPMGTPHQDGVPNLLKYAFNLDANAPDNRTMPPGGTSGLPAIQPQPLGNVFRFEYLRRTGSGLIYTPEKSSSLNPASWITLSSTPTVTPVNDTWERVVYEEPVNAVLTPVCFGRVRVQMP